MDRNVINSDGTSLVQDVGDGFQTWNKAIGADCGTIVTSPDGTLELWCDDDGLCRENPQLNQAASMLVGQQIVGSVIVFYPGDIK